MDAMYGMLSPVGGGDPFPLTKQEIVIGRHKSCDIVLNHSNVSGKHCKLVLSEGYWYILDTHSTNGVKLNGKKVTDHRVDPDAVLAVSKHTFKMEYDPRRNGASGLPPDNMLLGRDILTQSLMQRAGLEKQKSEEPIDKLIEEELLAPAQSTPKPTEHHAPKDFFSELVFD
jgi:pSer/pThr/pTyr-binding forkhead associated (FHA) protein